MNSIKTKSNIFLKTLAIALILLLTLNIFQVPAKAQDLNLPFDTEIQGNLTKETTSNVYKMDLTQAGRITINVTSYVDDVASLQVYDSNNEVVFEDRISGSSGTPGKYNKWVDLEPGSYYVQIYKRSSWDNSIGNYFLKATFTAANNNEIEPNNGTIDAQALSIMQSVTGFLSWNDTADVYKYSLAKAGRLGIDLNTYIDTDTFISLFDSENNEIFSDRTSGSSKNPAKFYKWVDLEPGNYYLKIFKRSSWDNTTGKYVLTSNFTAANNTETEPNNGTVEAQPLSFYQTVTGFLSWNDTQDYYKITLPATGKVFFNSVSYIDNSVSIQLINDRNEEIFSDRLYGTSKNPAKYSYNTLLEKGTYYLKVYKRSSYDDSTGKYTVTITAPQFLPGLTVDQVTDHSTLIKGKTAANLDVVAKVAGKEYKQRANSAGAFSISIPKQKAGTKIELSTKNNYGTKTLTVIVLDKTPPVTPTVKKVTDKSTTIEGTGEIGSTVYIYKGTKLFAKTTVGSKGTFKVGIPTQKKRTTLVIYALDKAGNKSAIKSILVQ